MWSNTFSATDATLANRGPVFERGNAQDPWDLKLDNESDTSDGETPLGTNSQTLLTHGSRTQWEGLIGYNDNHVSFEQTASPDSIVLTFSNVSEAQFATQSDNIFANEDDQTGVANTAETGTNTLRLDGQDDNRNIYLRSYYNISTTGATGSVQSIDAFYD